MSAQAAFARMQYAHKHFSPAHRVAFVGALGLGYAVRLVAGGADPDDPSTSRRVAARAALRVIVGLDDPPFGEPPHQSVAPRGEPGAA
jgi:hypothetical protein